MGIKRNYIDVQYIMRAICFGILVIFISFSSRPVAAQPGLQNYDCGGPKPTVINDSYGLTWMNDDAIISEGKVGMINKTVIPGYYQNEWIHLRYFPQDPVNKRHCFKPPVKPYYPYFVRGRFMHGGYDGTLLNDLDNKIQIGIEIDGELLQTIYFVNSTIMEAFTFLITTKNNIMEVCLLEQVGTPFITVFEMKEYNPESMYLDAARGDILTVAGRNDHGAPKSYRYPIDKYDRTWSPTNNSNWDASTLTGVPPILINGSTQNLTAVPPVWNFPPDIAITSAVTFPPNQSVSFINRGFVDNLLGTQRFIVYLYFAELDHTVRAGDRVFDVVVNNKVEIASVDVLALAGGRYDVGVQLILNVTTALQREPFLYTLVPKNTSIFGPILNAAETMGVLSSLNKARLYVQPGKSSNIGLIVGVAVGVSLMAIAIVVLVICLVKKKKKRKHQKPPPRVHVLSGPGGKDSGGGTYREVHRYEYEELVDITDDWKHVLGKGGFGSVYYGVLPRPEGSTEEPTKVALKKLSTTSNQGRSEFLNEVDLLSRVHHSKLVSLVGYCEEPEQVLIYDYVEEGTLDQWLHGSRSGNPHFDWDRRLHIALDAAMGLDYLHTGAKPNIIHRDVKSSNILLTKNWEGRVADFGLSKTGADMENNAHVSTMVKGTIGYLDPEYYVSALLTHKSDVYSFGVVMLEMVTARKSLDTTVTLPQHRTVASFVKLCYKREDVSTIVDPNLEGKYSKDSVCLIVKLALRCLASNGVDRPTMADVVDEIKAAIKLENLNRPLAMQSSYTVWDEDKVPLKYEDPHLRQISWTSTGSTSTMSTMSVPPNNSSIYIPQ